MISEYQSRLFNKLFFTLPNIKKINVLNNNSNLDFKINHFYYFKNKDFWFAKDENEEKYYFLFGLYNKPLNDICENDVSLIIDFDKNIQFNDTCLGLFGIKNFEIHILINYKLLKENYPNINVDDFKISNYLLFDESINLEIIDLGGLNDDFIDNIKKLIKASAAIKTQKDETPQTIKKDPKVCQLCSRKISDIKSDSNLKNIKYDLCDECIEKIAASEFYKKIAPFLKGNDVKEISIAKEKFGNDKLFDSGLNLLEKYNIIRYIGVKKLFFIIDKDSYLVKKYINYSDKNNLLIDAILNNEIEEESLQEYEDKEINRKIFFENLKSGKTKERSAENASLELYLIDKWYLEGSKNKEPFVEFYNRYGEVEKNKKPQVPKVVKTDSFGNKIIINQMNIILEDLSNSKSEDEAIVHANVSKRTYEYWINRGKQDFGELYVQFYQHVNEIKSKQYESNTELNDNPIGEGRSLVDEGIYEPLLPEYDDLFNHVNQTGIAWVDKIEDGWIYSRNINGKKIILNANTLSELYKKVKDNNLIWGIRDYDRAKKFIDFPDDFEIPKMEIGGVSDEIDWDIYKSLPEEYEKLFTSMNQTGIAWVNQIGSKFYYVKSIRGKNIRLSGENIYELYKRVKSANQIWGIRDYDRAKEFIDFPDEFEIPLKSPVEEDANDINIEVDSSIYSPLPDEYEKLFKHTPMNKSGIAWVSLIGKRWKYGRINNGKTIEIYNENIYELYKRVKSANQIWGIRDYDRAKKFIDIPDEFEIPLKSPVEEQENEIVLDNKINESIYAPLSQVHLSKFSPNLNNKSGIAWVSKVGNKWFYQRQRNGKIVRISDSNIIKLHEKVIKNNQIWGILDIDKARKVIETNSIDDKKYSKSQKSIKQVKTKGNVTVDYIEKSMNEFEILIKGIIKNKDLIEVLIRLDLFKENIKRIITTSINKESDIFIELNLTKQLLTTFEEQIEDLGWKINK